MLKLTKIVLTFSLSLFLISVANAAGDAEAGKAKAGTCIACHGVDGNSVNAEWPSLAGQAEAYTYKQLVEFHAREGRDNDLMYPMIENLTDQDMQDLAAYYASLRAKPGVAKEGMVELGEAIYRGGSQSAGIAACIGCHGPSGKGNPAAKYPRVAGQHSVYVASQLRMFRSEERTNDSNKMMRSLAHRMTDVEIDAVSEYIAGLR